MCPKNFTKLAISGGIMGRKLLKTVQTITTFRNPLVDPVETRRGPPLVRGPQFENHCFTI